MDPSQTAFVDHLLHRIREAQEYAEEMKRIAQEIFACIREERVKHPIYFNKAENLMDEIPTMFPWEQRAMRELQEEIDRETGNGVE